MRWTRIVPLTSLAIVGSVLVLGPLLDDPVTGEFITAPGDFDLPLVELGFGDCVLMGVLVDELGQPVPDAGITTEQAGRPLWTWTDPSGSFSLRELRPGPLSLRVVALGFEATKFDVEIDAADVTKNTREFHMDRRIGPPPTPPPLSLGDLTGTVILGPLATQDRSYELLLQPTTPAVDESGGFPRRLPVGADGSFRVDLLHAGPYRAILLSPDDRGAHGPDLLAGPDGEPRLFVHETGGYTPRLEVVAQMGAVMGRVAQGGSSAEASAGGPEFLGTQAEASRNALGGDAVGGDADLGQAVRGALVRIERISVSEGESAVDSTQPDYFFRATQSDPSGAYELRDLPPGPYRLSVVAGRERRAIDVNVSAGEVATIQVDLSAR